MTQMTAQRGLFRGPNPVCPDAMYLRVVRGSVVAERERLVVHSRSVASTDAYFGRFPASYWQHWTPVDRVEAELAVTGAGRVSLVASDSEGETRVVAATEVGGQPGTVRLTARLDRFVDGGYLWLDLETGDGELTVERLRWTVPAPPAVRRTAVVICTFNRADDCLATLTALGADAAALEVVESVYVVDHGSETVQSRPEFPEVDKALGGRLTYLRQPNLGGAGGFTRGLYEITAQPGDGPNVMFMDDDVLCEPDILVRMTAFANRTVEPAIVGGQMLRLLHPTQIFAGAERVDFENLTPGVPVDGGLDDADLTGIDEDGRRIRGDLRVDAEYNAWWACLIPHEAVARLGYPLPLFFQWDDIEYGYRARAAGIPTVTLPGAGLWHADFDWNDTDKWNEYFALRNALIVTALHDKASTRQTARAVLARVMRNLIAMQYGLAATHLRAVEDYLRGPQILHDGGAAAVAEIHKLRAEYPDTTLHLAADVPALANGVVRQAPAGDAPARVRVELVRRLISLLLKRTEKQIVSVPAADATWWHLSRFDKVVVTDASQRGVRLRRRDREVAGRLARQLVRVLRRLVAEDARVRAEYRAAAPELTTRENWRRLYGL